MMEKKSRKKQVPRKKSPGKQRADAIDKDIVTTMEIIGEMNNRLFATEKNLDEINKFLNVMSNTVNYVLAAMFVYERYLIEFGASRSEIQKEVDEVYYDAFTKNKNKGAEVSDYKDSIIKQINEQIKQFRERMNNS